MGRAPRHYSAVPRAAKITSQLDPSGRWRAGAATADARGAQGCAVFKNKFSISVFGALGDFHSFFQHGSSKRATCPLVANAGDCCLRVFATDSMAADSSTSQSPPPAGAKAKVPLVPRLRHLLDERARLLDNDDFWQARFKMPGLRAAVRGAAPLEGGAGLLYVLFTVVVVNTAVVSHLFAQGVREEGVQGVREVLPMLDLFKVADARVHLS